MRKDNPYKTPLSRKLRRTAAARRSGAAAMTHTKPIYKTLYGRQREARHLADLLDAAANEIERHAGEHDYIFGIATIIQKKLQGLRAEINEIAATQGTQS